jgi:hypothetical protein
MKDLELRDIFPKANKPLGAISVYRNGRWSFASLTNPTRVTVDQQFFRIDYTFGLHKKGSKNPAKYAVKGKPGDYVSVDGLGTFALVPADEYLRKFPTPQQVPTTPDSSEKLRDPNFLTQTQLESVDKDSDKVLIGDREFSLPSTAKQTITIIETPTGQAQAYYDASAGAMVYDYDLGQMVEAPVPDKPY